MPKTATKTPTAVKKPAVKKSSKKADSSVFAVIATGGKQYRVSVGERVKIEKMIGEYVEGDIITFSDVLLVDDGATTKIGEPYLTGSTVTGTLTKIARHQKVIVIKYKQKSRYFKKNGHRQPYFEVLINSIS